MVLNWRKRFSLGKRRTSSKRFLVFWILLVSLLGILFFTDQHHSLFLTTMGRGKCCQPGRLKHICCKKNCLSSCLNSRTSIPELEDHKNISRHYEDNAFFIETSGSGTLNFRQACAVESLALHNPKLTIKVLFVGGYANMNVNHVQQLREMYNNIQMINTNLDDYVAGSPLEYWYYCNNWRNGPFNISHLSDGLRFLTLVKYGGYYFDLDVISVRSVTSYRNFVVAEDDDYLGSSVIHADLKNPVMELALKDFVANYRLDIGGHNGPALLLRVMKNWCKVANLQSMDQVNCSGFSVLHYSSFYPVHCLEAETFFVNQFSNDVKFKTSKPPWLTMKVVGIHTWNQITHRKPVYKNSSQYYRWLAEMNCPFTFSVAPEVF